MDVDQPALVPITGGSNLAQAWPARVALLTLMLAAGAAHSLLVPPIIKQLPVGRLNDTGALVCYDGSLLAACSSANAGTAALYPHQDATIGRDAAASSVGLTKSGGGVAGFDFARVCFNGSYEGSAACTGNLAANTGGTASATATTDWACTRDYVTNLLWSLQSQPAWWADAVAPTFPDAGHNSANRCGFSTGWRVPTPRELMSLVHNGMDHPVMIDANYFPDTWNGEYWTSLSSVNYTIGAWTVDFMYGSISDPGQSYRNQVRLVRSISAASLSPLYANADGTVSDPNTGLMWDQCPFGRSGANCASGAPWMGTWQVALGTAVAANNALYKAYSDWRVPNRNELASIVNYVAPAGQPTVDAALFPGTPTAGNGAANIWAYFWTSTPVAGQPGMAWAVDFNEGRNGRQYAVDTWVPYNGSSYLAHAQAGYLRLVRGGQGFAAFDVLDTVRLKVTTVGAGNISGGAINCGAAGTVCNTDLPKQTIVSLTASPASNFLGWSGACAGAAVPALPALPTCTLAIAAATQVNAVFADSPLISFNPSPMDFGTVAVGLSSGVQSLIVKNVGTRPLNLQGISMLGDFSEKDSCAGVQLPVNGTCTLNIKFAPRTAGLQNGGARFFSDAPEQPQTAPMSGTGQVSPLAPQCTLSASPAWVRRGQSTTLTASCTPVTATNYVWAGGVCAGTNAATCVVSPTATTSYSVATSNFFGYGPASTATTTVTFKNPDLTPILMLLLD